MAKDPGANSARPNNNDISNAAQAKTAAPTRKLWWLVGLLLALVLITLLILLSRCGIYTYTEKNSIFLVPANPGFRVENMDQTWGTEHHVDLFRDEYYGDGYDLTVRSENGDKLIAPGTENEYTFNLKNTGNVAMDYSVTLLADLFINTEEIDLLDFPIGVRLRSYSGEYLLGDKEHWAPLHRLDGILSEGTLAVNHYAWYTLEWKWLFEEYTYDDDGKVIGPVGDARDTLLGNLSAETPLALQVSINTLATPNWEMNANGGIRQDYSGESAPISDSEMGGRIRFWPCLLTVLLLIALGALAYFLWHRAKRNNQAKADADDAVNADAAGMDNTSESDNAENDEEQNNHEE